MNYLNTVFVLVAGSVIWLAGCSKAPSPEPSAGGRVPPESAGAPLVANPPVPTNWITLTPAQRSELAAAVNLYALKGANGPLPSAVQDLKPIEVYDRRVNIVIAIRRDQGEEVGYYIQPSVSSFFAGGEPSPEWSLVPLSGADETGTACYAYRRVLLKK
jgi:hypothetical protein